MCTLLVRAVSLLALSGTTNALIGYGIPMYKPNCAFACRASFESAMLECSSHDHAAGAHSHGAGPTSPECRAGDTPWLTTLAYCINATCGDVAPWKLEKYWADKCTGEKAVQAKWTYQEALAELGESAQPTKELGEDEMLNFTALYNEETWEAQRGTLYHFEFAETMHSRSGIILLVLGFGTPILFTVFGYLPYMSSAIDKLKPRFVYPALIGTYHVRALPFSLGNGPTAGEALYVATFFILNIILTAIDYRSYQPNTWFSNRWQEIMAYISNRTGVIAFALSPLVILFSGRNNVLLWLTNWSHSTYMLLHRWVARIFALQVILHSICELRLYGNMGELATEQREKYWIWGVVATLSVVVTTVISMLPLRRLSYEVFLILHVLLAIFTIAGSWYHVEYLFTRKWGYELWLYAACAVWFADRLMRLGRMLKNGIKRADVTEVAEDIVRIDVKGVRWDARPGKHTYAYFPTLAPLRPWENHPFSIIPTALLASRGHSTGWSASSRNSQHSSNDVEKTGASATVARTAHGSSTSGVSLYVRKSSGLTRTLGAGTSLLTLLDGPYPNNSTAAVLRTDRLILIAGGIGISGTLPYVAHHQNVKLYWSVRAASRGLVIDLENGLSGVREKVVKIGERLDLQGLLEAEKNEGWERIGIVVCGPGGMCDSVRDLVAKAGRERRAVWELEVEAFSW